MVEDRDTEHAFSAVVAAFHGNVDRLGIHAECAQHKEQQHPLGLAIR
jgi:hypothetical protein